MSGSTKLWSTTQRLSLDKHRGTPGPVETRLFRSGLFSRDFSAIEHLFQFRRGHIADGSEEPTMIEPVDPLQGGVLHVV